jgi:hypothetical protein
MVWYPLSVVSVKSTVQNAASAFAGFTVATQS